MDYEKNTITIGPGVLNSQVYDMLYNVKKELRKTVLFCS
jgi:hypothetical protein